MVSPTRPNSSTGQYFFFQAEDGIRDKLVTGVQTCALPICYELAVSEVEVVQRVPENDPYPIQLKEHGVDFLLDRRHLWIRTPRQAAILRIRAEAIRAAREYMDDQGYILTDTPIFTPAACEGTTTLFEVQYIDE